MFNLLFDWVFLGVQNPQFCNPHLIQDSTEGPSGLQYIQLPYTHASLWKLHLYSISFLSWECLCSVEDILIPLDNKEYCEKRTLTEIMRRQKRNFFPLY